MSKESVLLTGGSSRRMGIAKDKLPIKGVPLGAKIARELTTAGWPVTVLGREQIDGYPFLKDSADYAGPLAALRKFQPGADYVFLCACDMPLFRGEVVKLLLAEMQPEDDAIVPVIDGRPQPLCGIYRKKCFYKMVANPDMERITEWLTKFNTRNLEKLPFSPDWITAVNTPDELQTLLGRAG